MKKIGFLLCVFTFLFSACKKEKAIVLVSCVPTNLQSNLIAFYPFSNGSLEDKSNFTNDLTNPTQAAPTLDRNGNVNCAYRFDANQQDLQFLKREQTAFLNNTPSLSISLWYQPLNSARPGGEYEPLIYRGEEPYGMSPYYEHWDKKEWSLALYDCRRPTFNHRTHVWSQLPSLNSLECEEIVDFYTDNWQHIVAVRTDDTVKIYWNGVFFQENTATSPTDNLSGIGDLFIGKAYSGDIDDIMIFNKELSQQEVTDLFNLESCCDE